MYDINKAIANEGVPPADKFHEIENWSEAFAKKMAEEGQITLSRKHWEVVDFLRDY